VGVVSVEDRSSSTMLVTIAIRILEAMFALGILVRHSCLSPLWRTLGCYLRKTKSHGPTFTMVVNPAHRVTPGADS
jgi:hypothetical protein